MLSRKGYSLVSAAIAVVGLGVFTGLPFLALSAIPLISYLVLSRLFSSPPHLNIKVSRYASTEKIVQGQTATFTLSLENMGPDLDLLEIEDGLPQDLTLEQGSNRFSTTFPSNGKATFTYSVSVVTTGNFRVGPIVLRATDGGGFFEETQVVNSFSGLRVFPTVEQLRAHLRLIKLRNWPGEVVSQRPGSGLEFHSIREYFPGDNLKRVNWKAYARFQKFFTNQYSAELAGEVMIVLDARRFGSRLEDESSALDRGPSAAATLAYALLLERNRVGLMIMGDVLDKVYPAAGRRQLDRILLLLSSYSPGSRWKISMVAHYLKLLFSRIMDVIIVTSIPDEQVLTGVANLRNQGYSVTVVSSSPEFVKDPRASDEANQLAMKIVETNRQILLRRIRKYANVIQQEGDQKVSVALQNRSIRIAKMRASEGV